MGMRKIKRVISYSLSLIMVISVCFTAFPKRVEAAENIIFSVTADKQEVKRGENVTVTVEMSGNAGAAYGIDYDLQYDDTRLELVGEPKLGNVADGSMISYVGSEIDGLLEATILKNGSLPNGVVFSATFQVKSNASPGEVIFTTPSDTMVSDGSAQPQELPYTVDNKINLSITIPATDISLNKTSTTIAKGETEKLTATLKPEDASSAISWSSSDEKVATVSEDGTVTAVGAGKTKITATANGHSASCEVTVNVPLKEIKVTGEGNRNTIKKGETLQLTAERVPEDTTETGTIQWSSSNEEIVTVNREGLVTANADGAAIITAQIGEIKGEYKITVREVNLTGISIKKSTTIHRGESETLTVTYKPEDTTDDRTVTWTSSDKEVATVDGNGKVVAVGKGEAEITAQVGNHTATCEVTVDVPLKSIIPEEENINLVKGQTTVIGYELNPEDADDTTVRFSSSDDSVAQVDPVTGKVTAKKEGNAKITLKGADNTEAVVTITVTEINIDQVILNETSAIVEKGQTIELMATVSPVNNTDDDNTIEWSSSDPLVATVSEDETQTGEPVTITATDKGGTVTITATAWNGTTSECTITVPVHIEGISLPQDKVEINRKNNTEILEITYSPTVYDDNVKVEWSSDKPEVAAVDPETGMITAVKEGTANITAIVTASMNYGYEKEFTATKEVTIIEEHLNKELGDTIEFTNSEALVKNQSASMRDWLNLDSILEKEGITDDISINWTSSDEIVASIDQTGRLSALKEGKTTVKAVVVAKDGSGNEVGRYEAEVEVEVREIPLDSIAFDKIIKEMQVGAKDVLHVIYNPQNTTDDRDVIWNSSDASVLTVDKNGNLTALKAGKAIVTATVGEKEISCEITVKAVDTGKPGQSDGSDSAGNETGAAKGDESGVRTGDPAMIILYVALFVGAMATIVLIRRRNRRVR